MKVDKYYVAAAVALLVILVIVFAQRSDWDKKRFILSTDSKGNLTSVSEGHFENEEKRFMAKAEGQVNHINRQMLKDSIALHYGYARTHCVSPWNCRGTEPGSSGNDNNGPSAKAPEGSYNSKVAWCFSQHCAGWHCEYNDSHHTCNRKKYHAPGLYRKIY